MATGRRRGVGILAAMTETEDVTTGTGDADAKAHEAVIDEALRLIDTGLSDLMHRELVSTDEVSDLLLDVRMLLTAAEMATEIGSARGGDGRGLAPRPPPPGALRGAGGDQRRELGRDRVAQQRPGRPRRPCPR